MLPAVLAVLGKLAFAVEISPVEEPNAITPFVPTLAVVYATPLNVNEGMDILCSLSSVNVPTEVPVTLISVNVSVPDAFIV